MPKRRNRIRLALLFLPIWLPLLAYTAFEWFVDPFPNSIWLLRVLNTKYLVHVRADLTIDGEPLVMERTFRCFEPVDYHWFPGSFRKGNVLSSNGQAGDTMAATTSSGRLFVINATDACSVLIDLRGPYRKPPPIIENPLKLSRGELDVPIVHELIGGIYSTQVDTYIVREWLLQGYHGVQVNDVTVQKVAGTLYRDWGDHDWFGPLNWARLPRFGGVLLDAKYAFVLPQNLWGEVEGTILNRNGQYGDVSSALNNHVESLSSNPTPYRLPNNNVFNYLNTIVYNSVDWRSVSGFCLRPPSSDALNTRTNVAWLLKEIIPCIAIGNSVLEYECSEQRRGIISSQPQRRTTSSMLKFTIGMLNLTTDRFERGYFLLAHPLRAVVFDSGIEPGLVSRR